MVVAVGSDIPIVLEVVLRILVVNSEKWYLLGHTMDSIIITELCKG